MTKETIGKRRGKHKGEFENQRFAIPVSTKVDKSTNPKQFTLKMKQQILQLSLLTKN